MLSAGGIASLLILAASAGLGSAQTFGKCNPRERDACPPDNAFGNRAAPCELERDLCGIFTGNDGSDVTYGSRGAAFKIEKPSDAPTVQSSNYIFFGRVDAFMRAAPGSGIITSLVLQSDDLDEIDWEFIGSDNTQVQTNYFSKGNTSTYDRGQFHDVSDPVGSTHKYTIEWTRTRLVWSIDGKPVRTLLASECKPGTASGFPETPMQVKLGTWVAGKEGAAPGTIQWAGGYADWSKKPFVAYYKDVTIADYAGGDGPGRAAERYVYGDRSGTWQSIRIE
ncbi:cell wall glucanosyltransferase Mwg2 [Metarhizium album ARSEF 1941]|uniref:Cell wall glucanosyltransferase Mwg2 n=1 Tax=Metarhizium album (strain ARSEF 1941) TaxID=1081103 RepID=A0A0B2WGC8_METAS|nr:cell wall glucanosyltransferase Mwg2 [Metarhizium album ARSEF 1941]KHN95061.1 cell wall glucanosyltransferase Mwg2 [Metarhizium album ARSEF 1941]